MAGGSSVHLTHRHVLDNIYEIVSLSAKLAGNSLLGMGDMLESLKVPIVQCNLDIWFFAGLESWNQKSCVLGYLKLSNKECIPSSPAKAISDTLLDLFPSNDQGQSKLFFSITTKMSNVQRTFYSGTRHNPAPWSSRSLIWLKHPACNFAMLGSRTVFENTLVRERTLWYHRNYQKTSCQLLYDLCMKAMDEQTIHRWQETTTFSWERR